MTRRLSHSIHTALIATTYFAAGTPGVSAGVIGTSPLVQLIAPPASVAPGVLESNTFAFLFQERLGFVLPTAVNANITAPGLYNDSSAGLTPGTIPAGTLVDSYYLHTDPVGTPAAGVPFSGSFTFSTPVLGIMALFSELLASQSVTGAPGTVYHFEGTGFELFPNETIRLSDDRRTIYFTSVSAPGQDDFRVLTESSIPEPSSINLFTGGGILLWLFRRRSC